MFRNYLKLAFRNLSRQKAFSIINITGLAVGLASSLLILLWVEDELSYDKFHSNAAKTYRITAEASNIKVAISPAPVGPALLDEVPDLVYQARIWPEFGIMIQNGEKKFEEKNVYYSESSLFDVFDFKLLYGDKKTALADQRSVVISEATAIKYFGTTDVLGKTLLKGAKESFTITGVLAKPEGHSHLQFDVIFPWAHLTTWYQNAKNDIWDNFDFYTYLVFNDVKDEAYINEFLTKLNKLYRDHDKDFEVSFGVQKLTDIHLHSQLMAELPGNGNYTYVATLSMIAVFIILIGCINFMNLSTARSARRAKEVGLRKVAGAIRGQLVRQFLGESILITVISLVLALILAVIFLPVVNNLVGKQLTLNFGDPVLVVVLVGVTILTGVLSGIYPALILSGFKPITVLKKDIKSGTGGSVFRNVLVVTQFAISIVLLVGTTVVYQQLNYIRSKDIGYNKENLLYIRIHNSWEDGKISRWRSALEAHPETANVSFTNDIPTNLVSGTANVTWQGKDPAKQTMFANLFVDENFVDVFKMEMASGRNFTHQMRGDSGNFLINETAAVAMGFTAETAVGQELAMWDMKKGKIVGVVKDFNFKPLRESIEPMILRPNTWGNKAIIKVEPGKIKETLAAIQEVWGTLDTIYPFAFNFLDEDLENLYKSEQQVSTMFSAFSGLAILISCLGLYGLSAYIAEQRTREIGIRKALGASISNIIYLLNTRFVLPVVIAMIIAAPIAWYAMTLWLDGFAYKIDFNWLLVAAAGGLALLISLITVSYGSIKAAKVNPVKSLRTE